MTNTCAQATVMAAPTSKAPLVTGRVISGIVGAFLLLDNVMKFVKPAPVVKASAHLGLAEPLTTPIGVILLACTILYLIPATAILGGILLTGYLGGTLFSHLRVGAPLFSHVLFHTYIGALIWTGLLLRDERVRALIRFRLLPNL